VPVRRFILWRARARSSSTRQERPTRSTTTPDTFYDIGSPAFRKLFGELRQAGFEIGLHASYRAFASPEQFAAEIGHLEAVSGGKVVGNRHHYWHMNPSDPEATLKLHETLGLDYDSSLIHNRYVGWRRGIAHPYFPFVQAERREIGTLQVPATWMDNQLFGLRGDNPGDPWELLKAVVDRAVALGWWIVPWRWEVVSSWIFMITFSIGSSFLVGRNCMSG